MYECDDECAVPMHLAARIYAKVLVAGELRWVDVDGRNYYIAELPAYNAGTTYACHEITAVVAHSI
jgi:hypothetical protein